MFFLLVSINLMVMAIVLVILSSFMAKPVSMNPEKLQVFWAGIALAAVLLTTLFSSFMVGFFVKPCRILSYSMRSVGSGKTEAVNRVSFVREIDDLITSHNQMLEGISFLTERLKNAEQEKIQADIKILQLQINPHFTYNTLDSIFWVARIQGADKVAHMISTFSRLLRFATNRNIVFVPLTREIQNIDRYIEILKFRFSSNIRVEYRIAEETKNLKILKLILQPIVENCFHHGFDLDDNNGLITIISYIENNKLILIVRDNGKGLAVRKEPSENCSLELHSGIGINNIDERIKKRFGTKYGVELQVAAEGGTKATVTQPVEDYFETEA